MSVTISVIAIAAVLAVAWAAFRFRADKTGFAAALDCISGFILSLILKAEQTFGPGTGQFKKASVIEAILSGAFFAALPTGVRKMITYDILSGIVDSVCEVLKEQMEFNKANVDRLLGEDNSYVIGFAAE